MKVKRALLSVSDKTHLLSLAQALIQQNIELIATSGTAQFLRKAGIPTLETSELTHFPEILEGRVKTLHPQIHAALLFRRKNPQHETEIKQHGITSIDLVIVNLYPFEKIIRENPDQIDQAIENIDIGGVALLRSSAKNFQNVTVISDPADYPELIQQLKNQITLEFRKKMAVKAFRLTGHYDASIANYFNQTTTSFPETFQLNLSNQYPLRYGENPHQKAVFYGDFSPFFTQLQGKELSYNNFLDIQAALRLIQEFNPPTVAIFKHTNPCGVGSAKTPLAAWEKAYTTDPQSSFGGIIILNRPLDLKTAEHLSSLFCEIILAPDFEKEAMALLEKKKNLRLLKFNLSVPLPTEEFRSLFKGILCQEIDSSTSFEANVVTQRQPTPEEWEALTFSWKIVKHVKSNAIVYSASDRTLGIGAGQMSRVDASKIAIIKAQEAGLSLQNSVIASDAFFPFPDGVSAAAEAGATAVIQPGGSVRDPEVIEICNHYNLAMVFTEKRHFRH